MTVLRDVAVFLTYMFDALVVVLLVGLVILGAAMQVAPPAVMEWVQL